MKIGVLAGTPVDTQMGVDFILSKGHFAIGKACSCSPTEQSEMQILHKNELLCIAIKLCHEMIEEGAQGIFVNCNSLSGAIDMNAVRNAISVRLVTPLDIYADSAKNYSALAVISANCQSLSAIEQVIVQANKNCMVLGAGLLPLVIAIENHEPPTEIYEKLKIKELIDSLTAFGCEALVLGCTHFPYLLSQIETNITVPVIDPSVQMLQVLIS